MNVWFDNSTKAGFEKNLINHYKEIGRWNHVVYEENDSKLMIIQYFEKQMKELESVDYIIPEMYDNIYSHLFEFIDMYSRNSPINQCSYDIKNIHDYLNLFNLAVNYYYTRFTREKIDLYIITRAPHIGIDYIKCLVAQELNIKTLILEQTLVPNRFYYYWNLNDYGIFDTSESLYPVDKVTIEPKFEMNLFYVQPSRKSILEILKTSDFFRFIRKIARPGKSLASFYNLYLYNSFKKNRNRLIQKDVDFSKQYVYFALHLQPEKTTSSWGGIYNDQLLALERLSMIIPDDWYIYVKENPKQGLFMRGEWYYKRLSMIPKVVMVPLETNTYQLLSKCQFASTISGTVGWEAIKGGKNVLVFGWGVWYKSFPGVFTYNPDLQASTITNNKIDHALLEQKFAEQLSKTAKGVIYKWYDENVDGFNADENLKTLFSSFDLILGY